MNLKTYTRVSGMIYILIALLLLWQMTRGIPMALSEVVLPSWGSWLIILFTLFMSYQGLTKVRK